MIAEWWAVLLAGALLATLLVTASLTQRLDTLLYDQLLRISAQPAQEDIVIVAVDEDAIEALGSWPWPRDVHARLVNALANAGARAVGYDVLFLEPSNDPGGDEALSAALRRFGRVCLPVLFDAPGADGAAFSVKTPSAVVGDGALLAHANLKFDPDGLARRIALVEGDGRSGLPQLAECVRRAETASLDLRSPVLPNGAAVEAVVRNDILLIPYRSPSSFRQVSASAVLSGDVPPELLRGAYVLVGATAAGLHDRYSTPVTVRGQTMPGVEINAHLLEALVADEEIREASAATQLMFVLAGLGVFMLALRYAAPRRVLIVAAGLICAAVSICLALLAFGRVWLPPLALVLTVLIVLPLWGWRRLEAVNAYMVRELGRFAAEPGLAPTTGASLAYGDTVDRQIGLLKETLARARESRRFALNALQGLPDATFITDTAGGVLFANTLARDLTSQGGAAVTNIAAVMAEFRATDGRPLISAAPGNAPQGWALEALSPGGAPYLISAMPFDDAEVVVSAWILSFTDLTQVKADEAQRERVIQLLSHDIRSPQNSLLALLEGASNLDKGFKTKVAGYARRTLKLAGDFLQIARAASPHLAFELVDLSDVFVEAIDDVWPLASKADVRIDLVGADEEHLVLGVRDLLTRALVNLLDNAIKYGPERSVITCRIERLEERPGWVRLSVADTGPGMSEDLLRSLFQPFHRSAATQHKDGVGLGLVLVQEVARRHGAAITCDSAPGGGVRFSLSLLMAPADERAAPGSPH